MGGEEIKLKGFPPYYDQPLWHDLSGPGKEEPILKGDGQTDILVVGGGFTGLSCAYELTKRYKNKRIIVVDAYSIGSGASGRNGGLMLNGLASDGLVPFEVEAKIYSLTMETIKQISETIQGLNIETSYGLKGTLTVYTKQRHLEMAHEYVEKINSLGIPIRYLYRDQLKRLLPIEGALGGVLDPYSGHLNGLGFLYGLKEYLKSQGVEIYEYSPVLKILEGKECKALFPYGEIKAKAVMLCTNAYTPSLGYFKREIMAIEHHVTATKIPPEHVQGFMVSGFDDDRSPLSYATFLQEGYVVFGGGTTKCVEYRLGNKLALKAKKRGLKEVKEGTKKAFVAYFPTLKGVNFDYTWSGPIALTLNRMPLMGVMGEYKNIYYSLGYNGHGVTLANLGGRVLADLYCGNTSYLKDLPFINTQAKRFPPDPIRYMGFHLYWKLFKRIPKFFVR